MLQVRQFDIPFSVFHPFLISMIIWVSVSVNTPLTPHSTDPSTISGRRLMTSLVRRKSDTLTGHVSRRNWFLTAYLAIVYSHTYPHVLVSDASLSLLLVQGLYAFSLPLIP